MSKLLARSSVLRVITLALLLCCMGWRATADVPRPERIISMSPNLTDILFALGAENQVVGVSDFCMGPPAAMKLPKVGGWANPNVELIASLQPDLIVVLGKHERMASFARTRGIRVEQIPMDSLSTIQAGIDRLGRLTGHKDAASSLTTRMTSELARLAERRDELSAGHEAPIKVFISMSREAGRLADLFTIGSGTYLGEALALAGGHNIFEELDQSWPQVSAEAVLVRRPDVILELQPGRTFSSGQRRDLIDDWQSLGSLPAVSQQRIHLMTRDDLLIAGLNFPDLVEAFLEVLWPQQNADEAEEDR